MSLMLLAGLGAIGLALWLYLQGKDTSVPFYGPIPLPEELAPLPPQQSPYERDRTVDVVHGTPPARENRIVLVSGDIARANEIALTPNLRAVSGLSVDLFQKRNGLGSYAKWECALLAIHASAYYTLDPALVRAIIDVENASHDPNAQTLERLKDGTTDYSVGLMQIRTATAAWIAPFKGLSPEQIRDMLRDPIVNLAVGMKYLYRQYLRYGPSQIDPQGPERLAWAAASYNAGAAYYNYATLRFSNQVYVERVMPGIIRHRGRFPKSGFPWITS